MGIRRGLSNKPKMTSRAPGPPHFSVAAMRGNQSHASWGFHGRSKIVISLHCPSTIMGRSAADGNHMPAGLTSPSQSLSKGRGDEDEKRREKWRHKAGEESWTERWEEPEETGEGWEEWKWRGRKHQMSVSDVWHNTCAQYAGSLLAGFPDLYSPEVGETAGWTKSFNF